jgi:hypothetical protein
MQTCGTGNDFRSFYSGHATATATTASLVCVHHQHLPLFGGGFADLVPCLIMIGVSATQMSHLKWIATPCLLTVGLLVRPAFGMEPAAPEATEDFCHDHWFAVAQCHDRASRGLRLMVGLDVGVVRDAAKAASPLFSSAQAGIPLGFGLDVPLTWHVSLGAEATYHFQLGESYSLVKTNGIDGGDLSTFNLVARVRL